MQGIRLIWDEKSIAQAKVRFNNLISEFEAKGRINLNIGDFSNLNNQIDKINSKIQSIKRISPKGNLLGTVSDDVYKSNQELQHYIKSLYGANTNIKNFKRVLDDAGNSQVKMTVSTKNAQGQIQRERITVDEATQSIYKNTEALVNNSSRSVSSLNKIASAFKSILYFASATTLVYTAIHKFTEGVQYISDLNTVQTNIAMIRSMDMNNVKQLTDQFSDLAGQLHTTNTEINSAAENFLRAGKSITSTRNLLKASAIGSAISGQTNSDMSSQLIAISNGFHLASSNAKEMMNVIDTLSTIDNNSSTSMAEVANALTRTASSAQMAGVSFKDVASYIATVSSVTRKSADSIGESFNVGGLVV